MHRRQACRSKSKKILKVNVKLIFKHIFALELLYTSEPNWKSLSRCLDCTFKTTRKLNHDIFDLLNKAMANYKPQPLFKSVCGELCRIVKEPKKP
jgi:hypothetical protein